MVLPLQQYCKQTGAKERQEKKKKKKKMGRVVGPSISDTVVVTFCRREARNK